MKIKPSLPLDVISPGPVPGRKTFFFFLTLLGFLIHPSLIAIESESTMVANHEFGGLRWGANFF